MYLIRHGQTDWNDEGRYQGRTDSTLDAIGQAQAARLAAALSRALLTAVYTSALSRARATAEAIAAPHALPIIVVEQLGEVALGAWEGMTAAEIREQFGPDVLDRRLEDPHFAPPGGETLAALQARALRPSARSSAAIPGRRSRSSRTVPSTRRSCLRCWARRSRAPEVFASQTARSTCWSSTDRGPGCSSSTRRRISRTWPRASGRLRPSREPEEHRQREERACPRDRRNEAHPERVASIVPQREQRPQRHR